MSFLTVHLSWGISLGSYYVWPTCLTPGFLSTHDCRMAEEEEGVSSFPCQTWCHCPTQAHDLHHGGSLKPWARGGTCVHVAFCIYDLNPRGISYSACLSPSSLPTLQKAGTVTRRCTCSLSGGRGGGKVHVGGQLSCDAPRVRPISHDNSCKRKILY